MTSKTKYILLAVILVLVLAIAALGYQLLTGSNEGNAETLGVSASQAEPITMGPAADFTAIDWDGSTVRLTDYMGTPMIVNFWASWCGPCKSELPLFQTAYETYGDQIQFLMVDLTDGAQETLDGAKFFLSEGGYTFPVLFDTTGSAVSAYELYSIPLTVAIDADGEIVLWRVGAFQEGGLEQIISKLLSA